MCAGLTSQNANDAKPYFSPEEMMQPVTTPARKWANTKFSTYFPHLAQHQREKSTNADQQQSATIALLLAQLQSQQARTYSSSGGDEKKDENHDFGLSRTETSQLLTYVWV